jgi:hypothetical protein
MPQLDVSFVLDDPMFQDTLAVTRRPVDPNGQVNPATQTSFTINAVIQMGTVEDLVLDAEQMHSVKSIVVHSRTRLLDATGGLVNSGIQTGYAPDLVTYTDTIYQVSKVWDYSRYGQGYYEMDCDIFTPNTGQ